MAKKRKRIEEMKEEREYRPPDFDRIEYIRNEVGVSKATIFAALFAIPMGLAAMFVMPVGGAGGGLIAGLAGLSFLWFLMPLIKVDAKKFTPMNWAGIMGSYFLLFLAVWVVLCNPPFADMATPEVVDVEVIWTGGSVHVNESAMGSLEARIPSNVTSVTVRAHVTDNTGVAAGSVMIERGSSSAQMVPVPSAEGMYEHTFSGVAQFDTFRITASDGEGNALEGYSFTIVY
jgi:hypothetical protein